MEIKNSGMGRPAQPNTGKAAASESAGPARAPRAQASGERVTLTEAVSQLLNAVRSSEGAPVDAAKVSSIKAALADGSYQVDHQSTALKLLRAESGLPAARQAD